MLQVIAKENIDEILNNPQDYVDDEEDKALVKIIEDDASNPTFILIGQDENDKCYYLVVEDNDVSEDYYLEANKTLLDLFKELLHRITGGI